MEQKRPQVEYMPQWRQARRSRLPVLLPTYLAFALRQRRAQDDLRLLQDLEPRAAGAAAAA